jgi:hypothetical protein
MPPPVTRATSPGAPEFLQARLCKWRGGLVRAGVLLAVAGWRWHWRCTGTALETRNRLRKASDQARRFRQLAGWSARTTSIHLYGADEVIDVEMDRDPPTCTRDRRDARTATLKSIIALRRGP